MKRLLRFDYSPLLALLIGLVLLGWVGTNPFRQDLFALAGTYSLLALGMYVPFVLSGSLSMAYSAYLAIGGYSVAIVAKKTDWSLFAGFAIGMLVSAVLAMLLGAATRRLSGFYLVAVTLLFGMTFETWLTDSTGVSGGAAGMAGLRDLTLFGAVLEREALVPVILVLVLIAAIVVDRLRRGSFGITIRAAREVPAAVEATGIRVPNLNLIVLACGAALASLGGSFFVVFNGAINPETFTLSIVFLALFMPLLGGQHTAWGAVVGAILVVEFTFHLDWSFDAGTLLFTAAVFVVLLLAPKGLLGYLRAIRRRILSAREEVGR